MLYCSGYPNDAIEPANAYLIMRSVNAVAGITTDWEQLKPGAVLYELEDVETG